MVDTSHDDGRLRALIAQIATKHHLNQGDEAVAQEEKMALLDWLRQSPLHVSEFLGLLSVESELRSAAQQTKIPLADLIAEARADLAAAEIVSFPNFCDEEAARGLKQVSSRSWRQRIAAAGALAACLAIGYFTEMRPSPTMTPSNGQIDEYVTGHGEQRTWELSDNTVIHLDSDSKIEVKFDDHSRAVDVAYGRSYFEVGKDPARPFHARVGNFVLQDVGTTFDVTRENGSTIVTVVEGQVAIWAPSAAAVGAHDALVAASGPVVPLDALKVANLRVGQQATIQSSGTVTTRSAVDLDRATAWVRQEIVLDHDTVGTVAQQFNRYNATQIQVDDPHIAGYRISGVFHCYDNKAFIAFLSRLPGVRVKATENIVHVGVDPKSPPGLRNTRWPPA